MSSAAEIFGVAAASAGCWRYESIGEGLTAFCPMLPDNPINAVSFRNYEPRRDGRLMRSGKYIDHPQVAVMFRHADYDSLWAAMNNLVSWAEEVNRTSVTVGSSNKLVCAISKTSGPADLGQDEGTGAFLGSVNFSLTLQ